MCLYGFSLSVARGAGPSFVRTFLLPETNNYECMLSSLRQGVHAEPAAQPPIHVESAKLA